MLQQLADFATKVQFKKSIGVLVVAFAACTFLYQVFEIVNDFDSVDELTNLHVVGDIGKTFAATAGATVGVFIVWLGKQHDAHGEITPVDLSDWIPGHYGSKDRKE